MKIDLLGQRALVTGGSRGIGRAIAETLADCGADVTAVGTDERKLAEVRKVSSRIASRLIDLSDASTLDAACSEIAAMGYTILVNCAGINALAKVGELSSVTLDGIMAVNFRAAAILCNAVVPGMAERRYGRIVNITSIFSHVSKSGRASYASSKFALDGFTKTLALDVAAQGILANCVAPGFIGTELTTRVLGEEGIREMVRAVPLGRLGEPAEIAVLVAFLASPLNSFVTGQNIIADGGFTAT